MSAATLLAIGVTILCAGWLWFYIVRPILEDFGWIATGESVNTYSERAPVVMSRSEERPAPSALSSKDGQSDGRTDSFVYERGDLTMFYKLLRKYGVPREEARPILKAMRVPLSNDVWADSAPAAKPAPADEQPAYVTPIVGRPTSARFESDPDFPYQAPAH